MIRGRVLQVLFLLASAACVLAHTAVLAGAPSPSSALMLALALLCGLCLRPRRGVPSDRTWGAVMAMTLAMVVLHLWIGAGHAHGVGAGAGVPSALSGTPAAGLHGLAFGLGAAGLHGLAFGLGAAELVIAMTAVLGIGIRRRRAGTIVRPARSIRRPGAAPAGRAG